MDANRAAHLRALVEAAVRADAAAAAAQAACDAAHKELDRCRERRRNTAIELQNALGNSQLLYGNSLVYISLGDGTVKQVPLERLPAVDPPAPPAPLPAPPVQAKPPVAAPTGKPQSKPPGK